MREVPRERLYAADSAGVYYASLGLGYVHSQCNRLEQAQTCLHDALAAARQLGDRVKMSAATGRIGINQARAGNMAGAREHSRQALELAEESGHASQRASVWLNLGFVELEYGDPTAAIEYSQRAADLFSNIGTKTNELTARVNHADACQRAGHHQTAIDAGQALLPALRAGGHREGIADVLTTIGRAHTAQGNRHRARGCWVEALETLGHDHPHAQNIVALLDDVEPAS